MTIPASPAERGYISINDVFKVLDDYKKKILPIDVSSIAGYDTGDGIKIWYDSPAMHIVEYTYDEPSHSFGLNIAIDAYK